MKNSRANFLFQLGLSSIFLVNSLTAWLAPAEFLELLQNNPLASAIAPPQLWLYVIGINDALLFLFILLGYWRKNIALWAAGWIVLVLYVTIGEGFIGFIEHFGILSLVAFYYFDKR